MVQTRIYILLELCRSYEVIDDFFKLQYKHFYDVLFTKISIIYPICQIQTFYALM